MEKILAWFTAAPVNWPEPYCQSSVKYKIQIFTKPRLIWNVEFWGGSKRVFERRARGKDMLRVEFARWGQVPEVLRDSAVRAPHPRTRERYLALYEITQNGSATQVAERHGRDPQTLMRWVHRYNAKGPESLEYRRSGGRRPFVQPSSGGSMA